jgi:hypothetical protein
MRFRAILDMAITIATLAAWLWVAPAVAQSIVTSDAIGTISMTVYRDPYRGDGPINAHWPSGYALITETRTISIPAGESVIRFEGVAEGMFPESAIVTGLPKGVKEKNRDARLLSPAGLVDAYLKRSVTLTRTDAATGKVRKQDAMITAGPNGGVILETAEGYEALRCTGLPERMTYGSRPKDLSAKPTLSVITSSDRAVKATVTLSYMASGFDWQANYVINAEPFKQGNALDMNVFAWLTVANGGDQSFANARLMVVAGKLNKERNAVLPEARRPELVLQCWGNQRTDQVPERFFQRSVVEEFDPSIMRREKVVMEMGPMPVAMMTFAPAPPPPVAAMVAQQEELGDLKLYNVPERVTVNAKGQKQIAMIVQPAASFKRVYRAQPISDYNNYHSPVSFLAPVLISDNEKKKGLGVPLPSGQAMLFENGAAGHQLVAQIPVSDRAVGDTIEWMLGASAAVQINTTLHDRDDKGANYRMVITNSRPYALNAEITLPPSLKTLPDSIRKVDGKPVWFVTVPANNDAALEVRIPNP